MLIAGAGTGCSGVAPLERDPQLLPQHRCPRRAAPERHRPGGRAGGLLHWRQHSIHPWDTREALETSFFLDHRLLPSNLGCG